MVSILIRTYNEGEHILNCLDILNKQSYNEFEVIFVDSGSTDGTLLKINEGKKIYGKIKLITIKKEEFTFGKSLNLGIENSDPHTKFIAILSAHAYPKDNFWLETLLNSIESSPNVAGVYGKQEVFEEHLSNWFVLNQNNGGYQSFYLDYDYYTDTSYYFSNANSIIRKTVWEKLRFDESLPYTEDWLWAKSCLNSGLRIGYSAKAVVLHSHPDSLWQYVKRRKNEIAGTNSVIPNTYCKISNKQLVSFLVRETPKQFLINVRKHGVKNGFKYSIINVFDFLIRYKYSSC